MTIVITLTLWSSNELRIDHKQVKAESQTQFDFNAKTNEKNERTLTEGPRKIWFRFFSQVGSIYFHLESINQISNCGFWSEMDGVYIGFLEPLRSVRENWALIWTLHVCPWFSKTMGAPNMSHNGLGSLNTSPWFCKTMGENHHTSKWTRFIESARNFKNGPYTCKTWFFWHF